MKGPRKVNPKSLEALRKYHIKKGEVRNPRGVCMDPETRAIKKLTATEVVDIGSFILGNNFAAIKKLVEDAQSNTGSQHSMLKVWIATVALKAMAKGDAHALDLILNRLIGKPKEHITLQGNINGPQVIVTMPSNGREAPKDIEVKSEPVTTAITVVTQTKEKEDEPI